MQHSRLIKAKECKQIHVVQSLKFDVENLVLCFICSPVFGYILLNYVYDFEDDSSKNSPSLHSMFFNEHKSSVSR